MKRHNNYKTTAIIVAAGRSTRMQMEINKQYIEINGIPVLARTLDVFQRSRMIDDIIVVANETDILFCKESIIDAYGISKTRAIVAGGAQRYESVYKGLQSVDEKTGIVAIHDGARPFITEEILEASIAAALEHGAACTAVPVKDTIKVSDHEGYVKDTLDRNLLWSIQTPQTFRREIIVSAHEKARLSGSYGTDDSVLVEKAGIPVKLVMGSYFNIKLTTREDIAMAEGIAKLME